jgi:hypothetical protein
MQNATADPADQQAQGVPSATYEGDDGEVLHGQEAIDAMNAALNAAQAARQRTPADQLEEYYRRLNEKHEADAQVQANRESARKAHDAFQAAREAGEPVEVAIERAKWACGRDSLTFDDRARHQELRREVFREVFRPRRRGCDRCPTTAPAIVRRAESSGSPRSSSTTRSSARSGDSGPSDEPEPERRRLCALCNREIPAARSSRALHCTNKHGALDRQRRKRQRDRARNQLPRIPTTADFRRMREISPEEWGRLCRLAVCRCNGDHLEFEPGHCFTCGRRTSGVGT